MVELLDQIALEIQDRIEELRPVVAEYQELELAAKVLRNTSLNVRRNNDDLLEARIERALRLIGNKPGITASEMGFMMGLNTGQMRSLIKRLFDAGHIKRNMGRQRRYRHLLR